MQVEPPANAGVLEEVADRLVRGRIACAAGCAVVGLAAGFDGVAWRAGPPLVAALAVAAATLLFALLVHHFDGATARTRAVAILLLAVIDAAVTSAVAVVDGHGVVAAFAPLLALSLAIHARALFRSFSRLDAGVRADPPPRDEVVDARVDFDPRDLHALRESLGIVRARAESLQLAAAQIGADELVQHDLAVLVRQTDECQRALKALEPEPRTEEPRAPPARLPRRVAWPNESTPLRS